MLSQLLHTSVSPSLPVSCLRIGSMWWDAWLLFHCCAERFARFIPLNGEGALVTLPACATNGWEFAVLPSHMFHKNGCSQDFK